MCVYVCCSFVSLLKWEAVSAEKLSGQFWHLYAEESHVAMKERSRSVRVDLEKYLQCLVHVTKVERSEEFRLLLFPQESVCRQRSGRMYPRLVIVTNVLCGELGKCD